MGFNARHTFRMFCSQKKLNVNLLFELELKGTIDFESLIETLLETSNEIYQKMVQG
jgi:hypothetical protein